MTATMTHEIVPGEVVGESTTEPTSRRILKRLIPLVKFCAVGVVNTGVYYVIYLLLQPHMAYLAAHLIAFACGIVVSFFLNARFTYKVRPTWARFALYPVSSLPNVILSSAGVVALVEWAHMDSRIAPLIATLVAIPISYLLAKVIMTGRRQR